MIMLLRPSLVFDTVIYILSNIISVGAVRTSHWKLLWVTILEVLELVHYIDVGIAKLEEYIGQAWKTRIYAHAMGTHLSSSL